MKRWTALLGGGGLAALAFLAHSPAQVPAARPAAAAPADRIAFHITFGEKQERVTDYSGTLTFSEGHPAELIPWRFFGDDRIQSADSWKLVTARAPMERQPDQPVTIATPGVAQNIVPKGFTVVAETPPSTSITIQTAHGTYRFRFADLAGGRVVSFEDGDVTVQAVPAPDRVSPARPTPDTIFENDYPTLAVARDGSAWCAWQIYRDGGDQLLVAHSASAGWSAPEPLTPAGQDLFHTAIAEDARGRMWVVWSQRQGEAWDLIARAWDGRVWSAARKLTNSNGPNFFHKLIRDPAGNLHLVWVAHMAGESHVMWSKLTGNAWSPAREISGASAWMPDAAADSHGNLWVAWDSYRSGNYDIFLREIQADGTVQLTEQVTRSPRFQAHASVAVDKNDRLWLAWDESGSNWGKDWARDDTWRSTTLYADRRPRVAVLENGKWSEPADPMGSIPERYNRYVENPKLTVDASGRVWMALEVRVSTAMNRSDFWSANGRWETFLTAYEGDRWRPAAELPLSSTRPDGAFAMQPSAAGIRAVWANDNRGFPVTAGQFIPRRYDVEFASFEDAAAPPNAALEAFAETSGGAAPVHAHEAADVARARSFRLLTGGKELRILRGDFHRHTEISYDGSGDGSLEDYFRYMIDAAGMDTGIVSDHSAGNEEYTWWRTEKAIDLFHIRSGFTPLFGYERSVPYPNGHRNVVFAQRGVKVLPISPEENQGKQNSGPILYPYLKQNRGICMLHSLATDQGSDYRDNDPEVEPLVEIYQGYHANYEYEGAPRAESSGYTVATHGPFRPLGFYWNGLAKGYKLGTESSSDHISTHTSYTMIYTPSVERRDIVDSMRRRHAYGATDNIVLDFEARDQANHEWMMGDAFDAASPLRLHVKVMGTGTLASIEIVKDGKFIYRVDPNTSSEEFDYIDRATAPGTSWYYVRVIQQDRNMAWSSPMWVTYR